MTISSDHPFLPPSADRDPIRRLRGRLVSPVTLWTAAADEVRAGLTVSSITVADGDPATVLGLVDPESDLAPVLDRAATFAITVLEWSDRQVADVFAGLSPSPGGMFRTGTWVDTSWGPVLADRTYVGCRLVDRQPRGFADLVVATIESVQLGDDGRTPLARVRGRYVGMD